MTRRVVGGDWERPGAAVIARRTVERAGPGATILLHDGGGDRGRTAAACPYLLAQLQRRFGITCCGDPAALGPERYRFGRPPSHHVCFRKPPAGPTGSTAV